MMDSFRSKKELRAEITKQRNMLQKEEKAVWDEQLCRMVLLELEKEWMKSTGFSWIFLYMDIRGEAGTGKLMEAFWKKNIRTALPKVEGKELQFYPVSGREDLALGYMGIPEPLGNTAPAEAENVLVLVPGLAFDRQGFRLGYGGGFYDRFFARCPGCRRWGLAYEFQIVENVPHEAWDKRMERIFTPERAIYCSRQVIRSGLSGAGNGGIGENDITGNGKKGQRGFAETGNSGCGR